MNDPRLELKSFVFQVEQMRMAQTRAQELKERLDRSQHSDDVKALWDVREMQRQLEVMVDHSISDFKKSEVRIAPEQITADNDFKTSLEASLKEWEVEYKKVEKELIDQSFKDVKAGGKSNLYNELEQREADLYAKIQVAKVRLGNVEQRIASPAFHNSVNEVLKQVKR